MKLEFCLPTLQMIRFEGPHIVYFWANYNNSLIWIKATWGWFPLLTMISSEGEQWGRYNLPRYFVSVYSQQINPIPIRRSKGSKGSNGIQGTSRARRAASCWATKQRREDFGDIIYVRQWDSNGMYQKQYHHVMTFMYLYVISYGGWKIWI